MSKYSLEVVSHHPEFSGKTLKKYSLDGIDTIGVYGDEVFSIIFRNNSWNKVQLKLSLDGLDILTGKLADTELSKDMWVVNGYSALELKAYPETTNGGAAFVFTDTKNSVAGNLTGDLSNRGIIAAAVYVEGYKEPYNHYKGISLRNDIRCTKSASINDSDDSFDFCCENESLEEPTKGQIKSTASIGAGQFVEQKIHYVQGLKEPKLDEIVNLKYEWWDQVKEKLEKVQNHPSGFPGDKVKKLIDLGDVPRVDAPTSNVYKRIKEIFSRV